MQLSDPGRLAQLERIANVFTPSRPVQDAVVFAGREEPQGRLTGAIFEPGRHAVIYGGRGVGKTSLANVVGRSLTLAGGMAEGSTRFSTRVSCARDDDYDLLWRRLLQEIAVVPIPGAETVISALSPDGLRSEMDIGGRILDGEPMAPPSVERIFRDAIRAVLIFDEFDAITDDDVRREFAETIKMMSDSGRGPTVVLVGVGHDIRSLTGYHPSVQRCTEQIEMPLMSPDEIAALVRQGFRALEMEVDDDATDAVVWFSRGFPAFAHSLCKRAAEAVTGEGRTQVTDADVVSGAVEATESLPYSLGEAYEQAVDSKNPLDQSETVLAAAAWLATSRFRPAQVFERLKTWGVSTTLPTVTGRLRRLASLERGEILVQHGDKRPSFEFRDPMMIAYVVIRNNDRFQPDV